MYDFVQAVHTWMNEHYFQERKSKTIVTLVLANIFKYLDEEDKILAFKMEYNSFHWLVRRKQKGHRLGAVA